MSSAGRPSTCSISSGAALGVGRRQVDLVEHGHDLEVVLDGLVAVGQRLRLDPLGGVDQEHRPLAGGQRAGDLVAEVDVAGRVDQVEDVAVRRSTRTFCALMVMPRSRSMSIESRYCSRMRRGSTAPVISRMRSDSVDLPWSTWLMMEKLRMRSTATGPLAVAGGGTVCRSYRPRPRFPVAWPGPFGAGAGRWPVPLQVLAATCYSVSPRSGGLPSRRRPLFETPRIAHVANIKSQIKRNRQNEKRRLRNKSVRAEMRTRTKNAMAAAEDGAEDSAEVLRLAVKRIDKAAAQGVIHKNTAANHKSRLVRRVNAIDGRRRVAATASRAAAVRRSRSGLSERGGSDSA